MCYATHSQQDIHNWYRKVSPTRHTVHTFESTSKCIENPDLEKRIVEIEKGITLGTKEPRAAIWRNKKRLPCLTSQTEESVGRVPSVGGLVIVIDQQISYLENIEIAQPCFLIYESLMEVGELLLHGSPPFSDAHHFRVHDCLGFEAFAFHEKMFCLHTHIKQNN